MSTDFNYGDSLIITNGPVRPKNRNVPMNTRYRVETYADIAKIPVPAVGELVFVLSDENNDNQQNIYVIKSLKASNLGIPDSLIDEVVPLKTFLGSTEINLSDYVTEDELNVSLSNKVDKVSGYSLVSDTEIARLANVDNYDDTELMNLIPDKTSDLENDSNFISSDDEIDADKINGKTISGPMTKEEYDAITDKDPNTIYLVDDDSSIGGLPNYTVADANKALTVNSNGTSVGWSDVNVDLDNYYTKSEVEERIANISTGGSVDLSSYATKNYVDTEIDNINIPTKVSQLENDRNYLISIPSEYITETEMNEAISNIVLDSGNITFRDIEENEIFVSGDNTVVATYGNIIVSLSSININEGSTGTFTVKLDKAPTSNQEVKLNVNNSNCTIDKNSLIFTPSNYSITQIVKVTGIHDSTHYSNKNSVVTLSSTKVTSKTITVTINNIDTEPGATVPVQSISLNKTKSTLNVNDTEQLTVTFNPTNATNQNVTWLSSDDTKATVVNGLVTGIDSGNATITATSEDGNKSATCSYTIQKVESGDEPNTSLKMFLNAEGGSERYDSDNCLIWLDQSGNGKNYTLVKNGDITNEKLITYLWPNDTHIGLSSGTVSIPDTANVNNNTGLTSLNFTWDIKFKYFYNSGHYVIIGNGTTSVNASNAFAIAINDGNIIVRGNYDKIAIVNPLTKTMVQDNFYRITVTNDGSTCKLYLDGEFITSCDSSSFTSIQSSVLRIDNMGYSYIKYYDRALSETEI